MISGTDAACFASRSILVFKSASNLCLLRSEPELVDGFGEIPGDTARLARLRVLIPRKEVSLSLLEPDVRALWAFESEAFLLIFGAGCWGTCEWDTLRLCSGAVGCRTGPDGLLGKGKYPSGSGICVGIFRDGTSRRRLSVRTLAYPSSVKLKGL